MHINKKCNFSDFFLREDSPCLIIRKNSGPKAKLKGSEKFEIHSTLTISPVLLRNSSKMAKEKTKINNPWYKLVLSPFTPFVIKNQEINNPWITPRMTIKSNTLKKRLVFTVLF
jgi:hypothetical protein